MRLYVDSADRSAAEPLLRSGLFVGLTTNPSRLEQNGIRPAALPDLYRWATDAGAQEVFLQASGATTEELIDRGHALRAIGDRVVVKAPATRDGMLAAAALSAEGCPVLLTAVFDAPQALIADAAGARYIAPFLGRIDDGGRDGLAETIAIAKALQATGSKTQVLAASVRAPQDLVSLAIAGVQCFTLAIELIDKMFVSPLTAQMTAIFDAAAARNV